MDSVGDAPYRRPWAGIMGGMRIALDATSPRSTGLRSYLFVKLTTDTGMQAWAKTSLEWQNRFAVQSLLHEWVRSRIVGADLVPALRPRSMR